MSQKLICSILLTLSRVCLANDTAFVDYAGQIQFVNEPDISIQQEVLEFISEKNSWNTLVRVTYLMHNNSDFNKELEIAFPLPLNSVSYCINQFTCGPSCDTPEMKLFVDGKQITGAWDVQLESADGKYSVKKNIKDLPGVDNDKYCDDPGASERTVSIPPVIPGDKPYSFREVAGPPCNKIQSENCEELKKLTKKVKCEEAIDLFNLKRVFKWKYTFPKRKQIKVVHEYRPGRGGYPGNLTSLPDLTDFNGQILGLKDKDDKLCIKEMWPNWESKINSYIVNWTTYTLRTGANWKGPIQKFELIIHRDKDEVVSTCFPGLKKISPTQFKSSFTNFTPTADIAIGYLRKAKSSE